MEHWKEIENRTEEERKVVDMDELLMKWKKHNEEARRRFVMEGRETRCDKCGQTCTGVDDTAVLAEHEEECWGEYVLTRKTINGGGFQSVPMVKPCLEIGGGISGSA